MYEKLFNPILKQDLSLTELQFRCSLFTENDNQIKMKSIKERNNLIPSILLKNFPIIDNKRTLNSKMSMPVLPPQAKVPSLGSKKSLFELNEQSNAPTSARITSSRNNMNLISSRSKKSIFDSQGSMGADKSLLSLAVSERPSILMRKNLHKDGDNSDGVRKKSKEPVKLLSIEKLFNKPAASHKSYIQEDADAYFNLKKMRKIGHLFNFTRMEKQYAAGLRSRKFKEDKILVNSRIAQLLVNKLDKHS